MNPLFRVGTLLLFLQACTSTIQKTPNQIESNLDTLPDQTLEETFTPMTHELEFLAKPKSGNDTVSVSAESSDTSILPHPTVVLVDASTGRFRLEMSPVPGQSGTVTVIVTATLGTRTKTKSFTFTITSANQPPEVEDFIDQTIAQGASLSGISFDISDRETPAASLSVTATSNNQTLLPNANIVLGGSGGTRTLALNPITTQNGTAVITLTVTDGDNESTTKTFNLVVTPAGGGGGGATPTITPIADQTINEDASTSGLAFTVGDADQPANTLPVTFSSSNTTLIPLSGIVITGTGANRTVTVTPASNLSGGPVTITLTVSDGTLTADEVFSVTVNSVNDVPTISDIANQTINANSNTGPVLFTIGDVETAVGSLTVTATSSNTTLVPNNVANIALAGTTASRNITLTPAANQYGTSTITVEVSDGTDTATDTFTLTVNEPPQTGLAFTYPHKNGFKIGESDDQAYTVHGSCGVNDVPVRFSINSGAVIGNTSCSSNVFSYTFNVSGIADGTISLATTNGTTNVTRTFTKETSFCVGAALTNSPFATASAGTRADPHRICTVTQLKAMNSHLSRKSFEIKNNIDLGADAQWAPIGPLLGTLIEGNNFQLKNAKRSDGNSYQGIFGFWGDNELSVLRNLHVYGLQFSNIGGYSGGLVSEFNGNSNFRFKNISGHGDITSSGHNVGGVVGTVWGGIGDASLRIIEDVYSQVDIGGGLTSIGGAISIFANRDGALTYSFLSRVESAGTVANCGAVSAGVISELTGPSGHHLKSNGNVSCSGATAGIVYSPTNGVYDSYNLTSTTSHGVVENGTIYRVFSTGTTSSGAGVSGNGSVSATNAFWNTQTSGSATSAVGTGLTTAQMQNSANFTGFDFSATGPWEISAGQFPNLKWETNPEMPTISSIADQTINEDSSTGAINITVGDGTTGVGSLTLSKKTTNTTLVPEANITFGGSGASRTVTVTPAANQTGTAWIFVDVSDGSLSDFAYFKVTVNNVDNDAPTISDVANQTINEDANTGALAVTISDPETAASSLTMSGSSSNTTLIPNANIVFGGSNGARTVTVTPAANQFGTATITIGVNDGTHTTQDTFTVTVNSVNDVPTITTIDTQTINEDTSTSAIAFTIGDVETAAGSLTISVNSDNATVLQNSNIVIGGSGASRTVTLTPEPNSSGSVSVDITVEDGTGGDVTGTFTLNVTPVNDAPTITAISNQSIPMNSNTGALAFTIGDAETAVGTLTVTRASSNITKIPLANVVLGGTGASRTVTVTPAAGQSGTVTITVTVNDGTTTTDETFDVDIVPPPSNLSYVRDYFLYSPSMPASTISLLPTVTGDVDSYSISPALTGTGFSFNTTTGEISATKPTIVFGPTVYTVTATNFGGSTNTQITMESIDAFYVTDISDNSDLNTGDGLCADIQMPPQCTLRAAVEEANSLAGTQSIIIPADTGIDISSGGPLSIDGSLKIYGESNTTSIVSAEGGNRIFTSGSTTSTIDLTRFQIRSGDRTTANGGAIYLTGNTLNLDRMRLTNNTADAGGAIYMTDSFNTLTTNLTITKSHFETNSAGSGDGGAIYFDGTNLTISDTTFNSNSATLQGGAIKNIGGTVAMNRNLFQSNSANYGGALNLWDGTVSLINNTFSANTATTQGGAVSGVNSLTLTVTNNTFYSNSGTSGGGALVNFGGSITIKNSLFDQNTGTSGNPSDCLNAGFTSGGYNLTSSTYSDSNCGFGSGTNDHEAADPGMSPLANNGGYTFTHSIFGAPAEDGGTNTGCPAVDGRGLSRSDGSCDIGAFEVQ